MTTGAGHGDRSYYEWTYDTSLTTADALDTLYQFEVPISAGTVIQCSAWGKADIDISADARWIMIVDGVVCGQLVNQGSTDWKQVVGDPITVVGNSHTVMFRMILGASTKQTGTPKMAVDDFSIAAMGPCAADAVASPGPDPVSPPVASPAANTPSLAASAASSAASSISSAVSSSATPTPSASSCNLLPNGQFITGQLSPWTDGAAPDVLSHGITTGAGHGDGSYFEWVSDQYGLEGNFVRMYQSKLLIPSGTVVTCSLWGKIQIVGQVAVWDLSIDGVSCATLVTQTNTPDWTQSVPKTITVSGNSHSVVLAMAIGTGNAPNGNPVVALDDVSITPVGCV